MKVQFIRRVNLPAFRTEIYGIKWILPEFVQVLVRLTVALCRTEHQKHQILSEVLFKLKENKKSLHVSFHSDLSLSEDSSGQTATGSTSAALVTGVAGGDALPL